MGAEDAESLYVSQDGPDDAVDDTAYDTQVSDTKASTKPTRHVNNRKKTLPTKKAFSPPKTDSKGGLSENAPFNPFDYEKKYPPDAFGEALAENARVWLTYLDEADAYDRDKIEGWKDNIDVLLVFTGLFSGIVSAFLIQTSQNLQQDYVQVSAFLLFEMVQLQRAHLSGISVDNVPSSPLTPNSPFTPSTNAMMVNALWFTSLTVSLVTALFAVLTKQWFRSYLSAIPGTALEKVKVRHFRFQGIVAWKVGFIVDLLPVLVHVSLGIFLIGLIIFVFPLDIHIASALIIFAGLTILFYAASVILPIRYPDCPYTISLTIFAGHIFHYLILPVLNQIKRFADLVYIQRFFKLVQIFFQRLLGSVVRSMQRRWKMAFSHIKHSTKSKINSSRPRNWREESLKKAIKETKFLDLKALHWLHKISSNQSIQRIIARSISIYPGPINESGLDFREVQYVMRKLRDAASLPSSSSTDVKAFSHQLSTHVRNNGLSYLRWEVIPIIASDEYREKIGQFSPDLGSLLDHVNKVMSSDCPDEPLPNLEGDLDLPSTVKWCYILANREKNAMLAGYVLTSPDPKLNPFELVRAFTNDVAKETSTSYLLDGKSLLQEFKESCFEYISRCFWDSELRLEDSKRGSFESRYVLLASVYRNLTSAEPLIMDNQGSHLRTNSLECNFLKFQKLFDSPPEGLIVTSQCLKRFQQEILLDGVFWGDKMSDLARWNAVRCFNTLLDHYVGRTGDLNFFFFAEEKELRFAYRWCSQVPNNPVFAECLQQSIGTEPDPKAFFVQALLLFMQKSDLFQSTIIHGGDPKSHDTIGNLRRCLVCLRRSFVGKSFGGDYDALRNKYLNPNLIRTLKAISPSDPESAILYHIPSLIQLCWYFAHLGDSSFWNKKLLKVLRSKLSSDTLRSLYEEMIHDLGSLTAESDDYLISLYNFAYQLGRAFQVTDWQFDQQFITAFRSLGRFENANEIVQRFSQDPGVNEQEVIERTVQRFGALECVRHQSSDVEEGEKLV